MEFFAAVEQWPAARLLRTSFYAYPLVNALHIAAIGALLTGVGLMDIKLLGGLRSLPETAFAQAMRRLAIVAFTVAVASGLALFSVRAGHYAGLPVFLAKMALIGLAGVNFIAFSIIARRRPPGGDPTGAERGLAVLSLALWSAVLVCGRFIGFV